jgi:hypothetical protein
MERKPLILSNVDVADIAGVIFSNDFGSWNVTRALRDCNAGKHKVYRLDVEPAYEACKRVEVDEAKVRRFMQLPEVLELPLVGVIEGGPLWLIDGHHRLRAMHRLGILEVAAFVIEEADAAPYVVWYNGKRLPPFKQY